MDQKAESSFKPTLSADLLNSVLFQIFLVLLSYFHQLLVFFYYIRNCWGEKGEDHPKSIFIIEAEL